MDGNLHGIKASGLQIAVRSRLPRPEPELSCLMLRSVKVNDVELP